MRFTVLATFAALIEGLVVETGREDLVVEGALPLDAKDWNEALVARVGAVLLQGVQGV